MATFWLKCGLVLIFGILGTQSGGNPFSKQPRLVVEDGHLTIRSGFNRNITLSTGGLGNVRLNNLNLATLASSTNGRSSGSAAMGSVNSRLVEMMNQWRSVSGLADQVSMLEENVTDISQRLNQFMGSDQNRVTNRKMRRYFAKVKKLEDKVNLLTELLSTNECSSNPCRNGGTCVDSYNTFACNCPPTWEGPTCEVDVNECALYAGTAFGCQNGATCTNMPGSYRCDCAANWYGIHCTQQQNDCDAASHQELCGHGTCVNEKRAIAGQPKYRCICDQGWTQAAGSAACTQDVDECQDSHPKCSVNPRVLCINLPGTFHCGPCPAGYTGNGLYCEDINECENQNGGCSISPFVECINTPGSRRCGPCPNGFFGNGQYCMYQSVCSNSNGGCHPLATCIENTAVTTTYRECRCPPGYVGDGVGMAGCVRPQGALTCENNPCQHGTCTMVGNSYHCVCEAGFYGTNCENAQDPCARNPCQNGGTCIRGPAGTFACDCAAGFSGPACQMQRRDCGGSFTGNNGTFHYPENFLTYEHQESCTWVITVQEGKVVNVTFDHFHLENGGHDCDFDFLQLNDGPNAASFVMGRYCGDQLYGKSILTNHNSLYLWFKSDRSISSTGFTLTWKAVDPVCGGVQNVSEYGSIKSPGYPGLYPVNRTCSWLVRVPFGKRIQFSFATLMLEHHVNCSYDYLKIYDGASESDGLLGTYCTTETPPPLITSGAMATLIFHSDHSVQDSGFNIAYSSIPAIQGCGGTMTAPRGVITSPNYPDVHDNNLVCEWLIRVHSDNRMKIAFEDLRLEQHSSCEFDRVEIYNGPNDASPLLGRFCGDTIPPEILSGSNQVYVRFKTDISQRFPGFKLEYSTICGGIYSEQTGILTSPMYPETYPAAATCLYHINLPQGYLVNLTLQDIEIEDHSDCRFDYLEIRDGNSDTSPLVGKICGYLEPQSVLSTYNSLFMKFVTDASVQNRGFRAEYSAVEIGCGGILTEDNGQLSSPLHPDGYPHSTVCTWLIRAQPGHIVRLSFSSFHLEGSRDCKFDYVSVQDAYGGDMGKFCGDIVPPVLTSLDDSIVVKFVTDQNIARDGFVANYRFLDASQACGGDFYQTSGILKSPGYPQHYPHRANCVWVLHAPNNHQITLNVTDFNLEYHDNCRFDYLEIRNGGYATSPLIGRYCGTQIMPVIRSHSTMIRIEFKSDEGMTAPGFRIAFDNTVVGCGGTVTGSSGSIVSPNYPQVYPATADCEWLIKVSEGSTMSLTLVDVDIEQHDTCLYDYLQIFDGESENSKSLLKICNNQQNPGVLLSKGNMVLVRFRSDFGYEAGGFHLVYHTECNTVLTKRRGVIASPNFPNSYPHNHNCTWTIRAPPGSNISIAFSHLFIEEANNCSADYVEILERTRESDETAAPISLGKFCGDMTRAPSTVITHSNVAMVRLVTDRSVSREGFRLEWSFVGCGADIYNKPSGLIMSPNYPMGYPLQTVCYWHIWYPPGNSIQFTVQDIDLDSWSECRYDFLKVYGGEDESGPVLLNMCHGSGNGTTITSHGNQIYVHFHSDAGIAHRGFKASFTVLQQGCGGRFTAPEASIMSPNFPDPYSVSDYCEWLIEISDNFRVELQFYDFELPQSVNCSQGYVAIYDGADSDAPLLLRHCGSKPEGPIYATSNRMLVKLVADGTNVGKGFRANYKTACGRRLKVDDGGEITSLHYPSFFGYDVNCSWILYASDIGEKVSLQVTHLNIHQHEGPCSYGKLYVYDGDLEDSPVIGEYCGHRLPPQLVSRSSVMHVFLQKSGVFRAVYGLLSQHCGGTFTSPEGSFSSPGYPTNYDMQMECVWTIEASPGSQVLLSFQAFHLETSEYCNSDYVEIHEDDPSGRLVGKFCGDETPSNMTAYKKLWIKFRSDDIGTAPGFLAHYQLLHNNLVTGDSGEIASPGYPSQYQHAQKFSWTILVAQGSYVSVEFEDIGIVSYRTSSCTGFVRLLDGMDEESAELGKFCGYQKPPPIVSTGNAMTVQLQANEHLPSYFLLRWSTGNETGVRTQQGDSCLEEHILNATSTAVLQSANHPQGYPGGYNCTYVVRTVPTHHVDLQFQTFDLEDCSNCACDKLESYYPENPGVDLWTLNSTLCGEKLNLHLSSPNNVLKLKFSTDYIISRTGFKATAKSECGGQLFGNSGVLRSSSVYPNLLNASRSATFQCGWLITVKERRTIQLSFDNFDIGGDSSCEENFLMIRNGHSPTSPPLGEGKFCGPTVPAETRLPESSSNNVYVLLNFKPTDDMPLPIFDLRYNVMTMGCGGHLYLSLDTPSVEVSSPNHPSPPTHDADCEWVILSPSGTRLRLDFESELQLGTSCYTQDNPEYLHIHDGGTEGAPQLRAFCGSEVPSSVMSTGNAMFIKFVSGSDDRGSGFKASVRIAQCGGTVSAMNAMIRSPNWPQNYGNSLECEWFLKMQYGYYIKLTIQELETPQAPGSNCSLTDYLQIRDRDKDGDILGTYCGRRSDLPIVVQVPGPFAYVYFKSNSAATAKGFSMKMHADRDEGCGGYLEGPSGVVTSPRYPGALNGARKCYWRILAPAGRKIKITFNAINLPYDEDTGSCESFVSIYNFSSRYLSTGESFRNRLCGTRLPDEVDSPTSIQYIFFSTRGLSAGQGFSLTYSTEEESLCGGVLPSPSGVLVSPNFTVLTDSYVECLWTMDLADNQTVAFKFDHLHLPGILANFCRPSVLYVYYSVHYYLGSYCGNLTDGFQFTAPHSPITLKLMSSLEQPIGGFRATYNISNCGGVLDGANVEITSPGYPNGYPANMDCEWQLRVPMGEIMQLTFQDLRMEADCAKDYVMVRNGAGLQAPILGKFCGSHSVAPITSTGGTIRILFHSDASGSAPGFRISTTEEQRGCGGTIHATRGNISSPNYPGRYGNNVECIWTFEYMAGNLVRLDFVGRFDIEMDASCSKDYLQLEDAGAGNTWLTGEKKCGSTTPAPFVSKSNKLRLTFRSNNNIQGEGFHLMFRSECGGNLTESPGMIISPNYPNLYPDRINCTYVIGKRGDYITLQFDKLFGIEGHDTCTYDYVEIYQGEVNDSNRTGKYCGDRAPETRTLLGPAIVRFVSDSDYGAHGFKLHYDFMDCGGVYTDESGYIGTTNVAGIYHYDKICTWHIVAPENYVIQLRFLKLELGDPYQCWGDNVAIYDGNSTASRSITRLCGKDPTPTVKSTGRELTIQFTSEQPRREFLAFYYVAYGEAQGCGGKLNSTGGIIGFSGPVDPTTTIRPQYLDCVWLILVNEPDQVVTLTFESFALKESRNGSCTEDFLEIRESSTDGPVLGTYCGNRLPGQQTTSATTITVHFRSDQTNRGGSPDATFRLRYAVTPSPCGPSTLIVTPEPQTVTSPGYPNSYPANIRCMWTLRHNFTSSFRSAPRHQIAMSITDIDIPCGGDYLEITRKEGSRVFVSSPPMRACGEKPPQLVPGKGLVYITFHSDATDNGAKGFSLTFRTASCNTTYSDDNGVVTSQSFPGRRNFNQNCSFNIIAPEGRTVALYFSQFQIHYVNETSCTSAYMKVHDGLGVSSPVVGSFCGLYLPNPVFSTGRSLFVEVYNPSRTGVYRLTYTTTDKGRGCGGHLNSDYGTFTSPFYPQPYNVSGECVWHISVPGYHTVGLFFLTFALSNSTAAHCDVNYLEVYEGSTVQPDKRIARFCGRDIPSVQELLSNEATVRLVTDSSNSQPGFYARFYSNDHVPVNVPIKVAQNFDNE